MQRLFGGSVVFGLVGLVLASFIVGFVLSQIGYSPTDVWNYFAKTILGIWPIAADAVNWAWPYAIVGALVVFPAWALYYLFSFLTRLRR